jgi:hypothetical protein
MNDSWVSVGLIVYFIAGSTFLLIAPRDLLVSWIQSQRPYWAERSCIEFVVVGRIVSVIFTLIFTFSFLRQHLGGAR